jgi:hypothetical protein
MGNSWAGRVLFGFGLFVMVIALCAGAASAQDVRNITVVNQSGQAIMELYIAPTKSDDWEEDVLGIDVLGHGESVEIRFRGKLETCIYDILAINEDEDEYLLEAIDLCETYTVTITRNTIRSN